MGEPVAGIARACVGFFLQKLWVILFTSNQMAQEIIARSRIWDGMQPENQMKDNRRLWTYLLINVIVSACTILAVLWIWDPANRPAVLQPAGGGGAVAIATLKPGTTSTNSTPMPQEPTVMAEIPKDLIRIEKIIGAGSAASEIVVLKRQGEGELQLTNWKLQDSNGNVYTFPGLTLFKDGAVYVHSAAGADTVIDLYWNQSESLWQSGEKATLIDSQGSIQATYQIP